MKNLFLSIIVLAFSGNAFALGSEASDYFRCDYGVDRAVIVSFDTKPGSRPVNVRDVLVKHSLIYKNTRAFSIEVRVQGAGVLVRQNSTIVPREIKVDLGEGRFLECERQAALQDGGVLGQ